MIQKFNDNFYNDIFDIFPKYDLNNNNRNNSLNNKKNLPKQDTFDIKKNKNTIISSLLTAGVAVIILAKCIHGNSIKEISSKISSEINDKNSVAIFYAKKGTDKTLNFLEAASNITTIKDVFFDKLLRTNSITEKFADYTINLSKKIIDRALNKLYKKVTVNINDIVSLIQNYQIGRIRNINPNQIVTIKGEAKTIEQWQNELYIEASKLRDNFNDNFGLGARKSRNGERDNCLKDTKEKIDEKLIKNGGWHNSNNYKTYITEEVTRESQIKFKTDIISGRKLVTNNIESICSSISSKLSELKYKRNFKDKEAGKLIEKLESQLQDFKSCSGLDEVTKRNEISNKMIKNLEEIEKNITNNNIYSQNEKEELINMINKIKQEMNNVENSKGSLEKIMTILKGLNYVNAEESGKIVSDIEYQQFKKLAKEISEDLNEATNKEIGEYFLKRAEIETGSAATDLFSLIFTAGAAVYAVFKCENKEDRLSASLKTCIPLVGLLSTYMYGAVKMMAGAKNLLFSFVSGIGLNKIGTYLDNRYRDYKLKGSVVKAAKDEYKNVAADLSGGVKKELTV